MAEHCSLSDYSFCVDDYFECNKLYSLCIWCHNTVCYAHSFRGRYRNDGIYLELDKCDRCVAENASIRINGCIVYARNGIEKSNVIRCERIYSTLTKAAYFTPPEG